MSDRDPLEKAIDAFVEDYVMEGDSGSYTPTEKERILIKDAIMGLLADPEWDRLWGEQIAAQARQAQRAQPEAVPLLTDEEICMAQDAAGRSFRRHQSSIRGQQIMPADSPDWHLARAIEAAVHRNLKGSE